MNNTILVVVIVLLVALLCCCLCFVMVAGGGLAFGLLQEGDGNWEFESGPPTPTPVVLRPTAQPTQFVVQDTEEQDTQDGQADESKEHSSPNKDIISSDTLSVLEDTVVPVNDLIDLVFLKNWPWVRFVQTNNMILAFVNKSDPAPSCFSKSHLTIPQGYK